MAVASFSIIGCPNKIIFRKHRDTLLKLSCRIFPYYIVRFPSCNYFFFLQCRKVVSVSRFILSTFHFTLSGQMEYIIFPKPLI
jgi:hypothetical protein